MSTRAFIETSFPVRDVSEESAREKSIRHGHISTLHIWWARRPLAASRATIYAALVPEPRDEQERIAKADFIYALSKWENSLDPYFLERARKDILAAHGGVPPRVLDPFAGGGSIPLEALRLGCETYASDLNPVAVLIERAVLEFPQRYGKAQRRREKTPVGEVERDVNPLMEDVRYWARWVLDEARKELGCFYPHDPDGGIPAGYIWVRTVRCQNPTCRAEIPLMRQTWLARKREKRVALRVSPSGKVIKLEIAEGDDIDFDPEQGTVAKARVVCPCCGATLSDKDVRSRFARGETGEKMVAVVLHHAQRPGKYYRLATDKDAIAFRKAESELETKRRTLLERWGIDPVPTEGIPTHCHDVDRPPMYGMRTWGELFSARQKLAIITFSDKVREAHTLMQQRGLGREYVKALIAYLALGVDRLADYNSRLARWVPHGEFVGNTFTRQALPMVWDYVEVNPFSETTGDWNSAARWITEVIEHCSLASVLPAGVTQASAVSLPYPDDYFDAVITDPPYYDNVGYANLSDFFYVWLRRTAGELYRDAFATPLTPKGQECVQDPYRHGGRKMARAFFETTLTTAFREAYRVLKPGGVAVIVFAHKRTDAWETIINALLSSGLYLTASWPLHTEMSARLQARESAVLASSVYMVCRKRVREETAYFDEIKAQVEDRIRDKLGQFWNEGIGGSDFFISAIGPALEVFGQYQRVETYAGKVVSAGELLEFVRKTVSEYALGRILKDSHLGSVDAETRFYLLWRWTYNGAKVLFDDARKLASAVGIELSQYWNGGFIKKDKEFISVLGPKERDKELIDRGKFTSMIDVLHACLLLWEKNDRKRLTELLEGTGYLRDNAFWQVAQSISEVLPPGNKEKQMLQGFLYGRETYKRGQSGNGQGRLF